MIPKCLRVKAFVTLPLLMALVAGCGDDSSGPVEPSLDGPPVLLMINGATQPSGPTGSTVIIEGANFGSFQGSGRVVFSDGAGGGIIAPVATTSDWANDFIVTAVPSGAATGQVWVQTVAGISSAINFTILQNAAFSPSTISWTASTSLPSGLSGHAAVFAGPPGGGAGSYLYVLGGSGNSGDPQADVLYSSVQPDGHVGAWTPTASLPGPVSFHGAVVATPFNSRISSTGFLYALGGTVDSVGTPSNTIYRGELNPDGSVASWTTAGSLPVALHSPGAVIFHGDLYVAGGAGAGDAPLADVYRARIDTTGMPGAWQPLSSLPSGRSYHGLLSFGSYLYALGGESAAIAPDDSTITGSMLDDVAYARINLRTGDLMTLWGLNSSTLTKAVSKHTAVIGGGYILVSAGIYNGAKSGSTEQTYAQINGDGSVSSFNGATGSHTILSAGGRCLFNHAAVSYTDASGVGHIMVIGGDDLNAPGQKRAETWFY